jgi:SAM-dependent methyltransferase
VAAGPAHDRSTSSNDTDGAGRGFFDHDYRRVLAPFHGEAQTRTEVAAIRELGEIAQGDRILDLGCGWGRHLAHFRRAGHDVIGIDGSLALLAEVRRTEGAGSNARPAAGKTPLVCGDMRALPLSSGTFDVTVNIATALGVLLRDAEAVATLSEVRRVLRPGGRFLLEGMHRDEVVARYAPRDRWRLEDGTEVRVRRRFDPATGISEEVLRWSGPGGSGEKRHRLRIRSGTELVYLLGRAGLEVRATWGDWDGEPFHRLAPRLVVLAARD